MHLSLRASILMATALIVAALLSVAIAVPSVFTVVALTGTTVLIMGGTGHPLSSPPDTAHYVERYMSAAVDNFVSPSSALPTTDIPAAPYNRVALITPEEDAPNYGTLTVVESVTQGVAALHSCLTSAVCDYNHDVGSSAPVTSDTFVVYGHSQSATIAMLEKAKLAAQYAEGEGPAVSFVLTGGNRPNGGLTYRDPEGMVVAFLLSRSGAEGSLPEPMPTDDTQYPTVHVAIQYDGLADAPVNPLNLLAALNAYMGMIALHPTYADRSLSEPGVVHQGRYGDTTYYLAPTTVLPLLMPLEQVPVVGPSIADALDEPLRVLVEAAYDRTVSPAEPTPFNPLYFPDPVALGTALLVAIPTGWDNAVENLVGIRPFSTEKPGPFGVGGPSANALDHSVHELTAGPTIPAIGMQTQPPPTSVAGPPDTESGDDDGGASHGERTSTSGQAGAEDSAFTAQSGSPATLNHRSPPTIPTSDPGIRVDAGAEMLAGEQTTPRAHPGSHASEFTAEPDAPTTLTDESDPTPAPDLEATDESATGAPQKNRQWVLDQGPSVVQQTMRDSRNADTGTVTMGSATSMTPAGTNIEDSPKGPATRRTGLADRISEASDRTFNHSDTKERPDSRVSDSTDSSVA